MIGVAVADIPVAGYVVIVFSCLGHTEVFFLKFG